MSRKLIQPTDEEDAAITAAALSDPEALPLTDEEFDKLKPMRTRGRPLGSGKKASRLGCNPSTEYPGTCLRILE